MALALQIIRSFKRWLEYGEGNVGEGRFREINVVQEPIYRRTDPILLQFPLLAWSKRCNEPAEAERGTKTAILFEVAV